MIAAAGPSDAFHIALVDDDPSVLQSLSRMLRVCGHQPEAFDSAPAFLSSLDEWRPDMLVVDLRMPLMDGLALQAALVDRGVLIPTLFLSGQGDVASSVRALRGGAIDFLEKPCDEQTLIAALDRAAVVVSRERDTRAARSVLTDRLTALTGREREVFRWVVTGRLNKQIAVELGTREKTIKVHRARVMTKMGAGSLAELVRMFDQLGEASVMPTNLDDRLPSHPPHIAVPRRATATAAPVS